ncbi:MAG: protein adenylyltransferase SelO [Gammaproteobacteria bacterium]
MIETLRFDNRFTRNLPPDPEQDNFRRQVTGATYSRVRAKQFAAPYLIAHAHEVAQLLGLSEQDCHSTQFAKVFAGTETLTGMDPHATCYGGHQFGNWAGQLGDGRAIILGEIVNDKNEHWTLQLKGAGPTPYSRGADGLAVLRSSVREFLCSEAMHHLGVPTTRALSLVGTGETVIRDMFYDGNPKPEPGAVVCRVAPSFTRFGSFEIYTSRGEIALLKLFTDYTIATDFPHLGAPSKSVYIEWFSEICRRTLEMILHWMRVGFVHGVMNTDNMSILGLTIDYGPYGWLEDYDPDWTPNTTDATGKRYRFGQQPQIALWNLVQLANAIYPLVGETEPLQAALSEYAAGYEKQYPRMMAAKLGLEKFVPETDAALIEEIQRVLRLTETDMTLFFRNLSTFGKDDALDVADDELISPLAPAYYLSEELKGETLSQIANWLRAYVQRLRGEQKSDSARRADMNQINPKYVLRNYLAQLAIDKSEQGDHSMIADLLETLRNPYADQPDNEIFAAKRPDWARSRAGCSMLSCSS